MEPDNRIDKEHLKENLKDGNAWLRLLFMLLFSIVYSVAEVVLVMVVVFQFLCVLLTGNRNDKVLSLGAQLSTFIYQIVQYLTYNSDIRPYPFSDWPSDAVLAEQKPVAKRAAGRTAPKKKAKPVSSEEKSGEAKSEENKPASSD
jgi:hypothetical protein